MAKRAKRLTRKQKIEQGKVKPEPKTKIAIVGNNVMAVQLAEALKANPGVEVELKDIPPGVYDAQIESVDKAGNVTLNKDSIRPKRDFFGKKDK